MELTSLTQQADALQVLEFKVLEAEETLNKLKAQYLAAARSAAEMFAMNGIDELTTTSGVKYRVETVSQCSIKKDAKPRIAKWLREHGADHLVKEQCIVPVSQREKLDEMKIIYEADVDCNTNAVKAFLLGALGQKGSPATITKEDIPAGLTLFQYETVKREGKPDD